MSRVRILVAVLTCALVASGCAWSGWGRRPRPHRVPVFATGDFRRYADGHSVVDWGFTAFGAPVLRLFSEVDAAGNDVLDVGFGTGDASYRTVKAPTTQFDLDALRATAGTP